NVGSEPGERLAQNAAAAADVEDAQPRKAVEPLAIAVEAPARGVLDEAEPHRVELVQHAHLAAEIPPFGRQRRKALDLGRIDGRTVRRRACCHRSCSTGAVALPPLRPLCIRAFLRGGFKIAPALMPEKPLTASCPVLS